MLANPSECYHKNLSGGPLSHIRQAVVKDGTIYLVCLNCGAAAKANMEWFGE